MNAKNVFGEIGIAGGLGAGIGLALAWSAGWPLWSLIACPFVCAMMAGLCHKPREVWAVVGSVLPRPIRWQFRRVTVWNAAVVLGKYTVATCYIGIGLICMTFPLICLCSLLTSIDPALRKDTYGMIMMPLALGILTSILLLGCGIGYAGTIRDAQKAEREKGFQKFPLSRNFPRRMFTPVILVAMVANRWERIGILGRLCSLTLGIPLLQLWGAVMLLFLITDFALTIFMLCSSTERLSAMCGGALGGLMGVLCVCTGGIAASPLFVIVAGVLCGFFASSHSYLFTQMLAAPARKRTVVAY